MKSSNSSHDQDHRRDDRRGADTWNGSLLCLKRGGRLVTCGSTSGVSTTMNLSRSLDKMAEA